MLHSSRHFIRYSSSSTLLPSHARVIIVGGGVIGSSVAFHLSKVKGWNDILLLEQNAFTSGTTWHAAGLVGITRNTEAETQLSIAGAKLYKGLMEETGQDPGFRQCGAVNVARTDERMTLFKRQLAKAQSYGIEVELLSPEECGEKWGHGNLMNIEDLKGGVWIPGDGVGSPSDLTAALLKGAKLNGAVCKERVRVEEFLSSSKDGTPCVHGVRTACGKDIACDIVVLCGGQWSRQVGARAGVNVPLHSAEHFYVITDEIEGVDRNLPTLRDPDGLIYVREWGGGLCLGGFETNAKPAFMNKKGFHVPTDFEFGLFEDDWDQFWPLYESGMARVPKLENASIRNMINGPESFTSDAQYLLGEAPEMRNFFVAAGFNSSGIASAGGAGQALAEWIVNGEPTQDLWPVDIRRVGPHHKSTEFLRSRMVETLAAHYQLPWPKREFQAGRKLRISPLYSSLENAGAIFGSSFGWERANYFVGNSESNDACKNEIHFANMPNSERTSENNLNCTFEIPHWLQFSRTEHLHTRSQVSLFDVTSFSKFLLQGRDAEFMLEKLCGNSIANKPNGSVIYTSMLNDRGGIESDVTITKFSKEKFHIISGTAQAARDAAWMEKTILSLRKEEDKHVVLTDVTSKDAALSLMGPQSRLLLESCTEHDLSDEAFPSFSSQEINVGAAVVNARRVSYVGELGYELYVPTESAQMVNSALFAASEKLGFDLKYGGYYAIDSLRAEKGMLAWGHDLHPEISPLEAGLGFAVDFTKEVDFNGKQVLLDQKKNGVSKRIFSFLLDEKDVMVHGGEVILMNGKRVGSASSAVIGHSCGGRSILLSAINHPEAERGGRWKTKRDMLQFLDENVFEAEISGKIYKCQGSVKSAFDSYVEEQEKEFEKVA
eukprot:g5550.t1